uniref:DEP domain-containing protein n=1 Tax=Macrostomum lignano TaxID=282301 RepID=A0A1I8F8H4_9PLAT
MVHAAAEVAAAGAGASGSAAGGADDNGCDSCTDSESASTAPPSEAIGLAAPNRQPTSRPSSMLSSDLDTTSFFDSEDDPRAACSAAPQTPPTPWRRPHGRLSLQNRSGRTGGDGGRLLAGPPFSSITESAFSLNVQTVELDMDAVQFLAHSIVGHPASQRRLRRHLRLGSIMRGGAVEREGSIQPGDMLLELCRASGVSGGGSSQVTPAASCMGGENLCDSRLTVTAASVSTSSCSLPESERYTAEELMPTPLTTRTDLITIVKAMALPDSGLEVRDPNLAEDHHTPRLLSLSERKEARKMALEMLKRGYIRHTVNKVSFSEQCYYVFGDCAAAPASSAHDAGLCPGSTAYYGHVQAQPDGQRRRFGHAGSPSLLSSILWD